MLEVRAPTEDDRAGVARPGTRWLSVTMVGAGDDAKVAAGAESVTPAARAVVARPERAERALGLATKTVPVMVHRGLRGLVEDVDGHQTVK